MSPPSPDAAQTITAFLRDEGAGGLAHAGGRTLLEHLVGTCAILGRWRQPPWLQQAALIHSVYGTDTYDRQLIPLTRRDDVAAVAGARAERLAYLFSVTPRRPLLAGTHLWARELPARANGASGDDGQQRPTRDELDALVLLHMANLAEQAMAADGSPGRWLVRLGELAELVLHGESAAPGSLSARLAALSEEDESLARRAYRDAVGRADDPEARTSRFALVAAICPVVPEPAVWLAYLSRVRGDLAASRAWAACARERLAELGTAWDKRLSFDEWLAVINAIDRPVADGRVPEAVSHPRTLFERLASAPVWPDEPATPPAIIPPDPDAGRRRFQRYVEALSGADPERPGSVYPDLPALAWHDPQEYGLVRYLEANCHTIRTEILALEGTHFHRESERIGRRGNWDVAFFYERGRRHDEICALCPVTTRGIESHPTIRTGAGLIYVSRMRGGTHIEAHRGPTNLRLRCHLGVEVPVGDCAIRVGEETRRWQEGRCLVFDDFLEHEAWNHTAADRIVLIVDLWHPGLSQTEVTLLEGLHAYARTYAERLGRYWSANAAARQTT